ncbi:tryptophan synthase subunit alpha [Streptomyces sp. NPDC088747]|uniref:tryptophan synthase subunit alpha n=1 Tax=Streptomyces sp. NPDC088747 TaxID=3365886 RepID=UPI00381AB30C
MFPFTQQSRSSTRLDRVLETSRVQGRVALGLYLPVGYPTPATGLNALHLLAQTADVIELGVPYRDGVLDGPVFQQASHTALNAGFRMEHLFEAARELSATSPTALLVMSYWQPLHAYGPARFPREAAAAGIDGVLVPDLPLEEAALWLAAARTSGIATIPLVSRRTAPARLARIVAEATGMLYAPATDGVTGNSQPLSPHLPDLIARLHLLTSLPVAAGIGISTPAQARTAAAWADVVMVGSAVMRRIQASPHAPTAAAAAAARDFAAALRPVSRPA